MRRSFVAALLRFSPKAILAAAFACFATCGLSGQQTCPATAEAAAETPASAAYAHGNYKDAEALYTAEVAGHPDDPVAGSGLIRTWIHEGKINDAATVAEKLAADHPDSAPALAALAEVQIHMGQPWQALDTLARAGTLGACDARVHYVRSRVFRLDSKYASERAEVAAANQIDPRDPDIHRAWLTSVQPAAEVMSIHNSLATVKDIDAHARQQALQSIHDMTLLLAENNQTCQSMPTLASKVTLPLAPFYEDARRIGGYRLEAQFPQKSAHLTVDTASSGLFISRAMADLNGFVASPDAPAGTVHVDKVTIGGLEFRDCIVGVSEAPFADGSDGYIGTDLFSPWLVELDQPHSRLTLSGLPPQQGVIPGDRPEGSATPAMLRGFTPVYHRQQYLLVPVTVSGKSRRLFVLDTGSRVSTMTSQTAHSVSTTKLNFTNTTRTVSGREIEVYRDSFDFQFASLSLPRQGHIVTFDPSNIAHSSGIQVAGLLGFDMLHDLDITLDYRDGLIQVVPPGATGGAAEHDQGAAAMAAAASCGADDEASQPLDSTIQGRVVGLIDSAHLRAGSKITLKVVKGWRSESCELVQGSVLYGHVSDVRSTKSPDSSEVSLSFDGADCSENGKVLRRDLSLKVIALVGPSDQETGLQSALPVQVSGGGRNISVAANQIGSGGNQISTNLNPALISGTIKGGLVVGMPGVQLQPNGGLGCGAKITGTGRSLHFAEGSEFLLTPSANHN